MKRAVAVIGASDPTAEEAELARQVGRLLAEHGLVVVCGGLGGVMAAACEGAKAAGGLTVGILPMKDKHPANPYVVTNKVYTNVDPLLWRAVDQISAKELDPMG